MKEGRALPIPAAAHLLSNGTTSRTIISFYKQVLNKHTRVSSTARLQEYGADLCLPFGECFIDGRRDRTTLSLLLCEQRYQKFHRKRK
ncbi:hypothetical protein AVEN_101206-1 [Araneus ventricosus]|uniref:Uncharacterized protein n=1 Tax=Araneus ventricosus TaxID=182803 RepID=A0A4Y2K7S4_ARAVE|nr:hypothetical protein AVEN_101206-1 [Araneus ventricosus]